MSQVQTAETQQYHCKLANLRP